MIGGATAFGWSVENVVCLDTINFWAMYATNSSLFNWLRTSFHAAAFRCCSMRDTYSSIKDAIFCTTFVAASFLHVLWHHAFYILLSSQLDVYCIPQSLLINHLTSYSFVTEMLAFIFAAPIFIVIQLTLLKVMAQPHEKLCPKGESSLQHRNGQLMLRWFLIQKRREQSKLASPPFIQLLMKLRIQWWDSPSRRERPRRLHRQRTWDSLNHRRISTIGTATPTTAMTRIYYMMRIAIAASAIETTITTTVVTNEYHHHRDLLLPTDPSIRHQVQPWRLDMSVQCVRHSNRTAIAAPRLRRPHDRLHCLLRRRELVSRIRWKLPVVSETIVIPISTECQAKIAPMIDWRIMNTRIPRHRESGVIGTVTGELSSISTTSK